MWTKCWLDYSKKNKASEKYEEYFKSIKVEGFDDSSIIKAAIEEITLAAKEMYGCEAVVESQSDSQCICIKKSSDESLGNEGYKISDTKDALIVEASSENAVIYGVFRLIALVRMGMVSDVKEVPSNPIRMLNHWDNMDGSIERGYSGASFFFENNEVIINERTKDYARMLASLGYNAVAINNVNVKDAATDLVNDRYIGKIAKLTDLFAMYGVKMFLCLNYAMPIEYEPASADPLDEKVIVWWKNKMNEIYKAVPNLGGFVVKADSEGRPGPFTYGRTQADGANMLAEAIKPHGGIIIWRCFVYNCQQDWRDLKTDRAKAGFDYFSQLDGTFAENVILQIKNGPMDFQVREPVSPLFGGMEKTNQMLEVQIAQEYTGHQIDVCYLIPWFKQILAFETYIDGENSDKDTTVAGIISGRSGNVKNGGIVAVTNTGNDYNWTGHDLAMANLYGFGRLSFDTNLDSEEIAKEWVRLYMANAIGTDSYKNINGEKIESTVVKILMNSWPIYEKRYLQKRSMSSG